MSFNIKQDGNLIRIAGNLLRVATSNLVGLVKPDNKTITVDEDGTISVSALTNLNLLDNGWFTVNQRGASSYSGNGIYTVDRWKSVLGNYTVSANGFTFKYVANTDNVLDQKLSTPLTQGETYTLSVKIGGVVYSKTFVANDSGDYERIGNSTIFAHMGVIKETLRLYDYRLNRDTTIQAIKLEYGSTSTLANDHAPNYADEYIRCVSSLADSSDNYSGGLNRILTSTKYAITSGSWQTYNVGFDMSACQEVEIVIGVQSQPTVMAKMRTNYDEFKNTDTSHALVLMSLIPYTTWADSKALMVCNGSKTTIRLYCGSGIPDASGYAVYVRGIGHK